MEGRTYPREWFEVSRFSHEPTARTFYGETAHTLTELPRMGSRRFTKKTNSYSTWYPTLEEAQAVIEEQQARFAEARRRDAIRAAGPFLLDALEDILDAVGALTNPSEFPNVLNIDEECGKAILAKIKELRA